MEIPQKAKDGTAIWSSEIGWGYMEICTFFTIWVSITLVPNKSLGYAYLFKHQLLKLFMVLITIKITVKFVLFLITIFMAQKLNNPNYHMIQGKDIYLFLIYV
jgi:hypothetical protein